MRLLFLTAFICFFVSCTKQKGKPIAFQGVWVESSLRLDTLDFEYGTLIDWGGENSVVEFRTNTYVDTVLNPNYPVNHYSTYAYYFTNNKTKINLRSSYSSSTYFGEYTFTLSSDLKTFTIGKFYNRRILPTVIEFVRIK
jgi:hypothetical protein